MLLRFLSHILILTFCFAIQNANPDTSSPLKDHLVKECIEDRSKSDLLVGWQSKIPYQYETKRLDYRVVTGFDSEVIKILAKDVNLTVKFKELDWNQQINDIKESKIDTVMGATYSDVRGKDVYFSLPYRNEENSLFIKTNSKYIIDISSISDLLTQIRVQNFRLGVIKNMVYIDPTIQQFITSEQNEDIIKVYNSTSACSSAMLRNEIDGFIDDKISGSFFIIQNNLSNIMEVLNLPGSVPVHFIFDKKNVSLDRLDAINQAIKNFINSDTYYNLLKHYLYSNMLLQLLHNNWFEIIIMVGTIAFAVSGVSLGIRNNSSVLNTIFLGLIPSLPGNLIKDFLKDTKVDGYSLSQEYLFITFITILIGFFCATILKIFNQSQEKPNQFIQNFWINLSVIGDAIGSTSFLCLGIAIAIILQISPVIFIPIIGYLIAHLGIGLRKIFMNEDNKISFPLNSETTIIWSIILSSYFYFYALELNESKIIFILIVTFFGGFLTKLFAYYLKIPSIKIVKV